MSEEQAVETKVPHGYVVNKAGNMACKRCGHPEKCHARPWISPNEQPRSSCVEFGDSCACM